MRWSLLLIVLVSVGLAAPCRADYVLLWTSPALFPASAHSAGAPLPSSYLGDLDGDTRMEMVFYLAPENPHVLQIRDAKTGALEGEVNVLVDAGGAATNVAIADMDGDGLSELLVSYVKSDGTGVRGLLVYGWQPPGVSVGETPEGAGTVRLRPNPFRQGTVLDFVLSSPGVVDVEVYDLAGRMVRKIETGRLAAGSHQVEWNGNDESNRRASAGTYFYVLKVDGTVVGSRKAVLLN